VPCLPLASNESRVIERLTNEREGAPWSAYAKGLICNGLLPPGETNFMSDERLQLHTETLFLFRRDTLNP
jgi:hypothetical protein